MFVAIWFAVQAAASSIMSGLSAYACKSRGRAKSDESEPRSRTPGAPPYKLADVRGEQARHAGQSIPAHSHSKSLKRIAVARNYIFGLVHLLREGRMVRRELVSSVGRLDQGEAFATAGAQAIDHFLGQDDAE